MYLKTIIENTSNTARGYSWYNRGMDPLHIGEKRLLDYEPRTSADSQQLKLLFDEDVNFNRVKVVYVTDAEVRKDVPDAQAFSIIPVKAPVAVTPAPVKKEEKKETPKLVQDKLPEEGFFEGKMEDAMPEKTAILGENAPDTHSLGADVSFEAMVEGTADPLKGAAAPEVKAATTPEQPKWQGGKKTSGKVK